MAKWRDDIVTAMRNLGGQAPYAELYQELGRLRSQPLTNVQQATARKVVEDHSSDSANFVEGRPDLFYSVRGKGAGIWGLRIAPPAPLPEEVATPDATLPEEVAAPDRYVEGATRTITVNSYERDLRAREECIRHFKAVCSVCDFVFTDYYGPVGEGFIHVHHLRALAEIRAEYEVDPVRDLRPVCPNCHAMLHRRTPAYTIEELKGMIERQRSARG